LIKIKINSEEVEPFAFKLGKNFMKITLLDLIIKGIPESAIFMLGIYAFSKTKIIAKRYWSTVLIFFVAVYLIRLLPINYGINTLLSVIITAILGVAIIKITFFKAIKAALLTSLAVLIGEGVNFYLLQVVYGSQKTLEIIGDPISKTINTIPSTIVFGLIIFTVYYLNVIQVKGIKDADIKQEDINNHMH